jgi:hypothetical protein
MGFTERELDSLQHSAKADDKSPVWFYNSVKKAFRIEKNNTDAELKEKFKEAVWHNIPKALFIYMPMFAFILWIFQNKRRWYYFDHGIFTLHYFSFLLLIYLISGLISCILGLLGDSTILTVINVLIRIALYCYAFYYFFPAHHRFYRESRGMTIIKGGIIFIINLFLSGILMLALIIYSFLNIH